MAVTDKAISGNAVKNNGGTLRKGGTVASSAWYSPALSVVHGAVNAQGATPKLVSNYTQKGVSGNSFGYIAAGEYQIIGTSSKIGGVASTVIKIPGQQYQRISINRLEARRSTDILTVGLSYRTGRPVGSLTVTNNSFGSDDATRLTLSAPGGLTFMRGSPLPYTTTYAARTSN